MSVLVDTSAWIDFFRGEGQADAVGMLIEENLLVTNDLILAELIPPLSLRKETHLIELLKEVRRLPLAIDWAGIVQMQIVCLRNGINKVGIPDLIIAQNAGQGGAALLSSDKHFRLMARHIPISIYH